MQHGFILSPPSPNSLVSTTFLGRTVLMHTIVESIIAYSLSASSANGRKPAPKHLFCSNEYVWYGLLESHQIAQANRAMQPQLYSDREQLQQKTIIFGCYANRALPSWPAHLLFVPIGHSVNRIFSFCQPKCKSKG